VLSHSSEFIMATIYKTSRLLALVFIAVTGILVSFGTPPIPDGDAFVLKVMA